MTKPLRLPAYRRLLVAYGLNELTWSLGTIALSLLVYRRTGSALGSTAFFLCSQFLPALVSPFMVAVLTGHPPRRFLPALYLAEGLLFGVLAWIASHFSLVPMLAVTLIDGAVAITARALARTASVDVLRPHDLLQEGNALTNVVFSVAFVAGPALGGLVVAAGGTVASLLTNCALFAVIALVLAATALPDLGLHEEDRDRSAMWRLRAAVAHVRQDRPVRWLLILQAGGMVAFTISIPVEVVFAQHSLHAGAGGYGAMLSGWGAGAVVGSAAYARWRRAPGRVLMMLSGVSLAAGFAVVASAPTITIAVIGSALGGIGNSAGATAAQTMLQEYTAQRWMGLVMGLSQSSSQAVPGLGFVLGGVITALANPRVALAAAAAGSLLYAVAVWRMLRPAVIGDPPARAPAPASASARPPQAAASVPDAGTLTR